MKLFNDVIAVERIEYGGVIEIPGHEQHVGRVIEVGPGKRWYKDGKECFQPTTLKAGDCIAFSHRAGQKHTVGDTEYLFMREADVMCVVDEAAVGLTENAADDNCEVVGEINVA